MARVQGVSLNLELAEGYVEAGFGSRVGGEVILVGDCKEQMAKMPDNSVDSIVTDPPYGLEFMGKEWDKGVPPVDYWQEALRVLKPGGHLLSFGGSRTYHRMACAIEDAGFEIRDQIMWVYGSGFPKSLNVGKAIDKAAGVEREVVGKTARCVGPSQDEGYQGTSTFRGGTNDLTAPATPEAKQWEGWGTALKPAHEPIVVARKPLDGTVANNVLAHGTGAMNIDGCRVGSDGGTKREGSGNAPNDWGWSNMRGHGIADVGSGRWPANFIHDGSDEVLELFPNAKGGGFPKSSRVRPGAHYEGGWGTLDKLERVNLNDSGSAARFFYCAKANKKERNAGLTGEPVRESDRTKDDGAGGDNPRNRSNTPKQNHHPTVKPVALMRYLVRLVTPPNGIVFDPFLGSGTTAVAAILEGFEWSGCEITPEYLPIIEGRVAWAESERDAG